MYGTIIRDTYRESDASDVRDALEELCSPKDRMGWASNGVYCFWDVRTFEVLYVGLARDLPTRFAQHNGLLACPESGCKVRQIRDYFTRNERLGYAVLLQSPFAQVSVSRAAKDLFHGKEDLDYSELVEHGESNIVRVEGALIEAHNRSAGDLPKWNKIHGSWSGRVRVKDDTIGLLWLMTQGDGPLVARMSIRELSVDHTALPMEETLHGARTYWLIHPSMSWHTAIKQTVEFAFGNSSASEMVRQLMDYCDLPDTAPS